MVRKRAGQETPSLVHIYHKYTITACYYIVFACFMLYFGLF